MSDVRSTPPRTFQQQRCYLAGPMRGYAEYNFPAFHAAAAKLRGHGLEVWSPAEHDVNEDGFDPAKDTAQPMRHYMKRDLPAVLDCDLVAVLPGWEKSQGACLEVHVAQTCGIPVYHADTMQPVEMVSETTSRWIPVGERMPEPDTWVLVHNGKWTGVGRHCSGDYLHKRERWQEEHSEFIEHLGPNVTHWMPLPEAPNGK